LFFLSTDRTALLKIWD